MASLTRCVGVIDKLFRIEAVVDLNLDATAHCIAMYKDAFTVKLAGKSEATQRLDFNAAAKLVSDRILCEKKSDGRESIKVVWLQSSLGVSR